MGNVLEQHKQQQVLALGRLGWTLRRIEQRDGRPSRDGRRVPAGGRDSGAWPRAARRRSTPKPAISGEVSTDSGAKPAIHTARCPPTLPTAPRRAPSASACEPYRELIVEALGRGRNAMAIWQDLVDDHGFPRALRQRPALRRDAPRRHAGRGARRHHDGARRRRPGRLRRGADGALAADRQVPTHAALCPARSATRAKRCGC